MQLFVTIFEATVEAAIDAIGAVRADHDGIEVRAEHFPSIDLRAIRESTSKPLIVTYRGARVPDVRKALESGIDFVDVEWDDDVEIIAPERTVLSHHDYESVHDIELIFGRMRERGCAHTKLAATPRTFADNERLLALLTTASDGALPATVIGMGERGLYSRILAPFRGSELAFVAAGAPAAPGQLSLDRARDIYGADRDVLVADEVFAVVGNPAGHSLSPSIHNPLFREKSVAAAYTIASVERFGEITGPFLRGEPRGLSITAPFKEDAFHFALELKAGIGENAARARAVNTLVNHGAHIVADNTDVDGFAALLPSASRAAVVGAGATARAALVALADAGIEAVVFNRTASKGDAPLDALATFECDLVINTLPAGAEVALPPCRTYIEAAYGGPPRRVTAERRIDGFQLLQAQAVRQHELFMRGLREARGTAGS